MGEQEQVVEAQTVQGPMARLVRAVQTFERMADGASWFTEGGQSGVTLPHMAELKRHPTDGPTVLRIMAMDPRAAGPQSGWVQLMAVVDILQTALEMASMARTIETLERQLERASDYTRLAAERELALRWELEQTRHAAAYGLESLARCPACGAERTNGEPHAVDCAITRYAREREAAGRTESLSEKMHHRYDAVESRGFTNPDGPPVYGDVDE